jgi:pimeloyl-ACP methyl ester carboxylesterase
VGLLACSATATSTVPSGALVMRSTVLGSGQPLVLMGGGIAGTVGWEPVAQALASGHRVIELDQLAVGYGIEDRALPPAYSIRTESAAVAATLDALGVTGPVDLVGHSSGALILLDFALAHPERVRTLTLSEPPAYWLLDDKERARPDVVVWTNMLLSFSRTGNITEDEVDTFVHALGAVPVGQSAKMHPKWHDWYVHRRSFRAFHAIVEQRDDPGRLLAFERPILLLRGEGTVPVHALIDDELAKHLPRAHRIELPGGHNAALASRDLFVDALRAFIESAK